MSGLPFWDAFGPGPPRERLGDHAGMGNLKSTKRPLFWTLFLEHIYDRCCICWVAFFALFSKPHFCQLSGLKGTQLHQFEAHLGTKLMTFPINLEKWQLRFRSREDIKIKLFRVCILRLFIIFWYVLPRPVMFTIHRRHYAQYPQCMDSCGFHFKLKFAICYTSFF